MATQEQVDCLARQIDEARVITSELNEIICDYQRIQEKNVAADVSVSIAVTIKTDGVSKAITLPFFKDRFFYYNSVKSLRDLWQAKLIQVTKEFEAL